MTNKEAKEILDETIACLASESPDGDFDELIGKLARLKEEFNSNEPPDMPIPESGLGDQ